MPWASPSLDACDFLDISEDGPWGATPSLDFSSLLDLPSSPRTWILENLLHAKLIATLLEGLVHKNKIFLQFQSTYQELIFFYNIRYCPKGLSKALALKKLHFARKRSNAKLRTESVKNRLDCKDEFFSRHFWTSNQKP